MSYSILILQLVYEFESVMIQWNSFTFVYTQNPWATHFNLCYDH